MEVVFVHGALVRDGARWWQPTADLLRERAGITSRALAPELPELEVGPEPTELELSLPCAC